MKKLVGLIFLLFFFLFFFFAFQESKNVPLKIGSNPGNLLSAEDLNDLNQLIEENEVLPDSNITENFFDLNNAVIYVNETTSHYSPSSNPTYTSMIHLKYDSLNAYSIVFTLFFDSNKFEFINASIGFDARIAGKTIAFEKISDSEVKINVFGYPNSRLLPKGEITSVNFKVKSKGTAFIDFKDVFAFDSTNKKIRVSGIKLTKTFD